MEVDHPLSVAVEKLGKPWARQKFGDPLYKDIRALGVLKEKETKHKKALVTLHFDKQDYFFFSKVLRPEPEHEGSDLHFINADGEEVKAEVSDAEEENAENPAPEVKDDVPQQGPEEEDSAEEEGGEEENLPSYNPCPFSQQEVDGETAKLLEKDMKWKVGPQVVDWGAGSPIHKSKTTLSMDAGPCMSVLSACLPLLSHFKKKRPVNLTYIMTFSIIINLFF